MRRMRRWPRMRRGWWLRWINCDWRRKLWFWLPGPVSGLALNVSEWVDCLLWPFSVRIEVVMCIYEEPPYAY